MTHEVPLIQHTPTVTKLLEDVRLRAVALGVGVMAITAMAVWALLPGSAAAVPDSNSNQVVSTDFAAPESFDLFADLFQPRESIPVAPARTEPVFGAPTEPDISIASTGSEEPGSVSVEIVPADQADQSLVPASGVLHPTPSWVNAFSPESTFNGEPLAVGDIVTAYDEQGVLIGRFEVEVEGKYGLMALYMDDPSTALDEGASPGGAISFRVNGNSAQVLGPHEPVWSSNGAVLMLNLSASN